MTTRIGSLDAWRQARDAAADNLTSASEFLLGKPWSEDPDSDFVRGNAEIDRIHVQLRELALSELKRVDDAIAAGGLVAEIAELSREAKEEAERLKNAAKTIEGIANAVNMVAGVVTKIAGLPFL